MNTELVVREMKKSNEDFNTTLPVFKHTERKNSNSYIRRCHVNVHANQCAAVHRKDRTNRCLILQIYSVNNIQSINLENFAQPNVSHMTSAKLS